MNEHVNPEIAGILNAFAAQALADGNLRRVACSYYGCHGGRVQIDDPRGQHLGWQMRTAWATCPKCRGTGVEVV